MAYEYVGFGAFQLAFFDNRLKWQGFDNGSGGYFVGVTSMVDLQISKITPGDTQDVYFLSWATPGGSDNVVISLKDKTVYAHLWSGKSSINEVSDFAQIHGSVLSQPSKDTKFFPSDGPTGMVMLLWNLKANGIRFNLPSLNNFQPALVQAHHDAKDELKGKTFEFGQAKISIHDDGSMSVTNAVTGNESKSYRAHLTKIQEGIYFISWLENTISGQHIVVNTRTKKAYSHVLDNGKDRQEEIFDLIMVK